MAGLEDKSILVICRGDQEDSFKSVVCNCRHFAGFIDGQVTGTAESNFKDLCEDRFPFTKPTNCRAL